MNNIKQPKIKMPKPDVKDVLDILSQIKKTDVKEEKKAINQAKTGV